MAKSSLRKHTFNSMMIFGDVDDDYDDAIHMCTMIHVMVTVVMMLILTIVTSSWHLHMFMVHGVVEVVDQ